MSQFPLPKKLFSHFSRNKVELVAFSILLQEAWAGCLGKMHLGSKFDLAHVHLFVL